MKKGLLFTLSIALCFGAVAQQVTQHLPHGFQRAHMPASLKKFSKSPLPGGGIDNQVPVSTQGIPLRTAPLTASSNFMDDEVVLGGSFYDLQTNNSISNRLSVNDDGTISAAWTFSPNSLSGFPQRGSGYNYWDGTSWLYPPSGPPTRQESIRTGFTNIVVTPISELLITHSIVGTDSSKLTVAHRPGKGSGAWTLIHPFGNAFDTWPKACAAGSSGANNNVYLIWQGSGTSTTKVDGQLGPVYFSRSTDGGLTWDSRRLIDLIDSTFYAGFGGDSYSIDAKGDVVAITLADTYTDVVLLKSTDGGVNWVKKIIQKHPIPFYASCGCGTYYIPDAQDTTADLVNTSGGDSKVLIDNGGMCHVWFSDFAYLDDDSLDQLYSPVDGSDGIFYWNENMAEDVGGARSYVLIATAQDFNGNDTIDVPNSQPFFDVTCTAQRNPWGDFGGGVTQMPSAGIDANGRIFLTYQTLAEFPAADTAFYHIMHRHVYMMTLTHPYDPSQWTYPYDIIPSQLEGGDGENYEGVFACTGRNVDGNYAYVLYQRDNIPGHALAPASTCDVLENYGSSSDQILTRIDVTTVGIKTNNGNDLFVSQNYPNPSLGTTYINVGLKKSSKLSIEVCDVVGKIVYSESKGLVAAGNHSYTLNTSNWETGIYNYTVTMNGEKTTRQMIVQ